MDNNLYYNMDMQLEPYNGLEVRFDRSWLEQILLQIGKFKICFTFFAAHLLTLSTYKMFDYFNSII